MRSLAIAATLVSASLASASVSVQALAQSSCDSLGSTNAVFQCLVGEYKMADRQLNAVWNGIQDTFGLQGASAASQKAALLEAQKAWIKLRDLDCAALGKAFAGGSQEKVVVQGCLVERTNERIMFFMTHYSPL